MMNAPTPVGKFDRQKYIGSSDAAAILGVSKWKTPFQLYQEKIGEFVEEITPEQIEASECASHSDNRLVYFTAGDGTIQIHRRYSGDRLDLCPAEARELYLWLANSGIWKV